MADRNVKYTPVAALFFLYHMWAWSGAPSEAVYMSYMDKVFQEFKKSAGAQFMIPLDPVTMQFAQVVMVVDGEKAPFLAAGTKEFAPGVSAMPMDRVRSKAMEVLGVLEKPSGAPPPAGANGAAGAAAPVGTADGAAGAAAHVGTAYDAAAPAIALAATAATATDTATAIF
jgi:hypothetical protein